MLAVSLRVILDDFKGMLTVLRGLLVVVLAVFRVMSTDNCVQRYSVCFWGYSSCVQRYV